MSDQHVPPLRSSSPARNRCWLPPPSDSGMGNGGCCLCCSFFLKRRMPLTPPLLQRGVPPTGEVLLLQGALHAPKSSAWVPSTGSGIGSSSAGSSLSLHMSCQDPAPAEAPCGATASFGHASAPGRAPPWAAGGPLLPCSPPLPKQCHTKPVQSQYRDLNAGKWKDWGNRLLIVQGFYTSRGALGSEPNRQTTAAVTPVPQQIPLPPVD